MYIGVVTAIECRVMLVCKPSSRCKLTLLELADVSFLNRTSIEIQLE